MNSIVLTKYKIPLVFVVVFLLSVYPIADTDFGWHLATGEYIFQNKTVPKTDLFSFSLPQFPYVYYSWAGELFLYTSQRILGPLGPSVFFALILTLSIFFLYKTSQLFIKNQNWLLIIMAAPIAQILAGGRMRVFGLLFFSAAYYLLTRYIIRSNNKSLIFIPLIFLLWSNFHASFILGIGVLFLLLLLKFSRQLFLTLIFSVAAIFINPYFYRIWQQALTITSNEVSQLKTINPDWQSPLAHGPGGYIYVLVFLPVLAFVFKSKLPMFAKALNLIIFVLSLFTQRFLFALLVAFLPVANFMIFEFASIFKKQLSMPIVKISLLSLYLVLALLTVQNVLKTVYAHSNFTSYANYLQTMSPNKNLYSSWSPAATTYLLENYKQQNILTDANWGGLLLLADKNVKLFYYGAMDNFNEDGKLFPFIYLDLVNAKGPWQNQLEDYNVEAIYLPNTYPLTDLLRNNSDYQLVFTDSTSSIFVKN